MADQTTAQLLEEMRRVMQLRAQQMEAAALCRDAGELDSEAWDGFAARYAAAVREYRVLQHLKGFQQPAMAYTKQGTTWVQG